MATLINHSVTGQFCPSSDTEDELLLSPGKAETYMQANHSKRSVSPSEDEYSPLSASPSDNRRPKRMKRDSGLESDGANLKLTDVFHRTSTVKHTRNLSDSDVLARRRSTRKDSATATKKPVSTVTLSSTSSTLLSGIPDEKWRAQSVPLFTCFNDVPRIDLRNPPPSPKRTRSCSPSKDPRLNFRIISTPFAKLRALPNETSSALEAIGESGSTLKAAGVLPLLSKITEETQPTAPLNETDSFTSLTSTIKTTSSEIPSTPLEKQSLNKLMPMSPLTPLPETPFPTRLSKACKTAAFPSEKVLETASIQPPAELNANGTSDLTTLVPSGSGTLRPNPQKSKLPRAKRRQPTLAPNVDRVTRSVSSNLRQKGKGDTHLQPVSVKGSLPVPAKRTASGSIKGPLPAQNHIEATPLPFGSPMKSSPPPRSITRDISSMTEDGEGTIKTGVGQQPPSGKTPAKSRIPVKLISSPSPSKLARTISRFSSATDELVRSFSMNANNQQTAAGSSLSTLSNALEKLRMPPPSRPNTSMGFNRDGLGDDDDHPLGVPPRSRDDETVGRVSLGLGQSEFGLKRAATLGASTFKCLGNGVDVPLSSKMSGTTKKPLVQKPLTMFMGGKAGTGAASQPTPTLGASSLKGLGNGVDVTFSNKMSGTAKKPLVQKSLMFMDGKGGASQPTAGSMRGMRPGLAGKTPTIFGIGGGLRRTISKKTSLPSVMASPVKGGGTDGGTTDEIMQDNIQDADQDGDETLVPALTNNNDVPDDLEMQGPFRGKEKASTFGFNASRRVSMVSVSHSLSQSLNSLPPPQPKIRGLMGPPVTPPARGRTGIRSSSSTYPSTLTSGDSPSQSGTSMGTRSSARIAKTAPSAPMKIKGGTGGHISSGRKGTAEGPTEPKLVPETLKILNDCTIFVDVRTDDGDEAGSLFIDMLGGVGARVLTRVGQTCTHIVFKNGLMSTLTRYRMLRDPKPLVVGIAWVVECVEQRRRVDETKFLVDVEDMHYGTGTSKRRRSMLPRAMPSETPLSSDTEREDGDADQSIDGSSSSIIIDEALPPLELARRRKSMLVGPRP